MSSKFKAQLDGFDLDVAEIADGHEVALALYEYPFSDGADMDHLGARARSVRVRAYWIGAAYPFHEAFVDHVKTDRVFRLVHPKYGPLYGRVESVSVRHDDREETAEVDFLFIEERDGGNKIDKAILDERIVPEIEQSFVGGMAQQQVSLADQIKAAIGTALGSGVVGRTLAAGSDIISQFGDLTKTARAYVSAIDEAERSIEATLYWVENPATSIISTVNFASNLPGRVIGAMARVVERYAEAVSTITSSPSQFIAGVMSGVRSVRASVRPLERHLQSVAAMYLAVRLGYIYDDDEQDRHAVRRLEKVPAWDALGNFVRTEQPPGIYTIDELERSLATIREEIQAGYDDCREISNLREVARLLLYHVNEVKLQREQIVSVSITRTMPLHLVCLRYGLPYTYADRILSINPQIANPSFVEGEVRIYAR